MDGLSHATTNIVGLRGFAEIAYGVYVANAETDLGSSSFTIHNGCSSSSLLRLRKAEAALRVGGYLGSLDRERGNLWVFFDQDGLQSPDIIRAADETLRNAGCRPVVPVGSSIKANDLLQESNTPLRRLFLTAVRALVGRALTSRLLWVPLNAQTYLRPSTHTSSGFRHESFTAEPFASYVTTIDLQLYSDGLVSVNLQNQAYTEIMRLSDQVAHEKLKHSSQDLDVFLTPIGRIAKLVKLDSELGASDQPDVQNASPSRHISQLGKPSPAESIWKRSVLAWLDSIGVTLVKSCNLRWGEIELHSNGSATDLVLNEDTAAASESSALAKRVLWPLDLIFVRSSDLRAGQKESFEHIDLQFDDPISFVEEWAKSASNRADAIGKRKAARIAKQLQQDQFRASESLRDDEHVDTLNIFPRTYQDASSITGIYPTPPDGALSQATPGPPQETASDTPKERDSLAQNQSLPPDVDDADHMDLFENNENTTATLNGSLYDDDLFDEDAGGNFTSGEIADEPNWDFFDEQAQNSGSEDPVNTMVPDARNSPHEKVEHESVSLQDVKFASEQAMGSTHDESIPADSAEANDAKPKSETPEDVHQPLNASSEDQDTQMEEAFQAPVENSTIVPEQSRSLMTKRQGFDEELQSISETGSTPPKSLTQRGQDDKYSADGRFWFRFEHTVDEEEDTIRHSKARQNSVHALLSTPGALTMQISLNRPPSPDSADETIGSDSSNYVDPEDSDLSDKSIVQDGAPEISMDLDVDMDPSSITRLVEDHISALERMLDDRDFSLGREYFCDSATDLLPPLVSSKENLMNVAQVFVDQIAQSTLRTSPLYDDLQDDLSSCLFRTQDSEKLLFHEVAGMPDTQCTSLRVPHIQVKRDEKVLRALPSLLNFWDTFALQPASGTKDVMGYCIYPDRLVSTERCENFLDRLGDAYSSCSLGSHVRGHAQGKANRGLVPWVFDNVEPFESLAHTCEHLGAALPSVSMRGVNYVIYIMNPYPPGNLAAPAAICAAFLRLFSSYLDSRSASLTQPIDVALQIVPISFISSSESLVILPQSTYLRLAIEVYNRCPPPKISENFAECGSAVTIARPALQMPTFSLSPNARPPATAYEKVLHVAYCHSPDERWVTAAWTNAEGSMALTMSYCLRQRKSNLGRSLTEIIREIWDTSLDLARASEENRKFCWRLIIAKTQYVEPREIKFWKDLHATQASSSAQNVRPISMTIVALGTRPSLKVKASSSSALPATQPTTGVTQSTPHPSQANYGTPATTPTPAHSVLSPEQLMISAPTPTASGAGTVNAPTPPAPDHSFEVDPDAVLTDPSDESEYLILPASRTLNNTGLINDYQPAVLSSYLLHRTFIGAALPGQLAAVGIDVNLVYNTKPVASTTAQAKTDAECLIELLEQYHALTTLAKTRGMSASLEHPILPWHLETATRGVKALSKAL